MAELNVYKHVYFDDLQVTSSYLKRTVISFCKYVLLYIIFSMKDVIWGVHDSFNVLFIEFSRVWTVSCSETHLAVQHSHSWCKSEQYGYTTLNLKCIYRKCVTLRSLMIDISCAELMSTLLWVMSDAINPLLCDRLHPDQSSLLTWGNITIFHTLLNVMTYSLAIIPINEHKRKKAFC